MEVAREAICRRKIAKISAVTIKVLASSITSMATYLLHQISEQS
jgi:hypothetical protein